MCAGRGGSFPSLAQVSVVAVGCLDVVGRSDHHCCNHGNDGDSQESYIDDEDYGSTIRLVVGRFVRLYNRARG